MPGLLVLLGGALLLLSLLQAFRNRRRNELIAKIPGFSVWVPLAGNALQIIVEVLRSRGDIVDVTTGHVKRYGPIYKMWSGHLPLILVSNPDDIEAVLTHPATADKGTNYGLLSPWLGDGLLLAGGQKWHSRRKLLSPAFSVRVLEQFVSLFNKHSAVLEAKLLARVGQPPFDITPLTSLCALDIIAETSMGVQIHAQTQEDSDFVRAVKTACHCFFVRQMYPWLRNETLLSFTSTGKKFAEAVGVLRGMTHRVINQRVSEINSNESEKTDETDDIGLKQRAVLLDHMLTFRGRGITDEDIKDEVSTFMFAGQDTTMTALCFALHLLSLHPNVQERVLAEVRDVVGEDGPVLPQHLAELKFLECVIKEALRLYPSVPAIVRDCKQEFTLPSGYTIPVGAQVGVSIINLHRSPALYPRPLEFDPDRFLNGDPAHRFAYIPFSASALRHDGDEDDPVAPGALLPVPAAEGQLQAEGRSGDRPRPQGRRPLFSGEALSAKTIQYSLLISFFLLVVVFVNKYFTQ
ncbi:Cytochrome P450 4C1, partial [Frankliniella fusca]